MNDPTKMVTLKNGTSEVASLVAVTMHSINKLTDDGFGIAIFELVELSRNPQHVPFGNAGDKLKAFSLASEKDGKWTVHNSIRNVVLSAASGEGMDVQIGDPIQDTVEA